jgi:hypothetical protein
MATNGKIPPTITLAQLYEAQQQFFDAFLIYKKIYEQNPSEEIQERMTRSQNRIFMDSNIVYNNVINKIFTQEDKELFRILPEDNYNDYQGKKNESDQDIDFVEEEFEEDEYDMSEAEEIEQIYNPADLPPFEDFTSEMENPEQSNEDFSFELPTSPVTLNASLNNLSLSEFSTLILQQLGPNKKVKDLTISDLLHIFSLIKK